MPAETPGPDQPEQHPQPSVPDIRAEEDLHGSIESLSARISELEAQLAERDDVLEEKNGIIEELERKLTTSEILRMDAEDKRDEAIAERDEAREESRIDHVTGVGNRRAMDEQMLIMAAESERRELGAVGVLCFDVEGLKRWNDEYHTTVGDSAMRRIVDALKHSTRSVDRIFRGSEKADEFYVMMPLIEGGMASFSTRDVDMIFSRMEEWLADHPLDDEEVMHLPEDERVVRFHRGVSVYVAKNYYDDHSERPHTSLREEDSRDEMSAPRTPEEQQLTMVETVKSAYHALNADKRRKKQGS